MVFIIIYFIYYHKHVYTVFLANESEVLQRLDPWITSLLNYLNNTCINNKKNRLLSAGSISANIIRQIACFFLNRGIYKEPNLHRCVLVFVVSVFKGQMI